MADKTVEQPEVPVEETAEKEVKKVEEAPAVEGEETNTEKNGDAKENGEADKEKNGKKEANGDSTTPEDGDKCCIKRKSVGGGGDAPEESPAEGATPEKKAKLEEPAEAETNPEAEVAA